MNSFVFEREQVSRFVSLAHVESLKWFALVAMLVEHYFRYVAGELPQWAFVLGRTVFPLFALSLAAGLARSGEDGLRRVLSRLAIWFVIAGVAALLVRDAVPLNVLGTLGLGIIFREALKARAWLVVAASAIAGLGFEFGPAGVAAVALFIDALEERGRRLELALGFGFCVLASASFAPLLAVLVVAIVQGLDLTVPRVRHAFYFAYAAQFPLFWVLS